MKTFKQLLNEGIDDFIKQKNLKDHINPALMKEVIITLNKRDYKVNIGALLTPYLNTKSDFNIFTLNKTDKIIVHTIIIKDTIDEVVQWALKAKNNQQNNLFNALVDYAKSKKII